ncbi:unnamed protein product [Zymoseptoria tritici ST99CH_1A5]|uniref:Uncharacterized protein n=1 Tax=Zymoseptoria tritici ST99CH_1A5 TaxID=1276529 RepID=A0A1Y6LQV8_ZYMTR|nr:unnamed protein product [Zymoseptoria tritici ST99CH_1A5]
MPTTRSQSSGVAKKDAPSKDVSKPATKRKATDTQKPTAKKQRKDSSSEVKQSTKDTAKGSSDDETSITINRAPVLELWASSVAHVLHPSLSWSTCLSIGGAISTITAISKGRSIGKIQKPDPDEAAEKKQKRQKSDAKLEDVDVMGFNLHLDKDGQAMVGEKPKKSDEEALKKKYGPDSYEKAKAAFEEALKSWKGKEDELNGRAFHMYEDFRPSVAAGQSGWGRKGVLDLERVKNVVRDA